MNKADRNSSVSKPAFSGEKRVAFASAFRDVSQGVTKIKQKDYLIEGLYPIIDQGQDLVAGYSNMDKGFFADVPAIVFGDHTRCVKYVDEPFFAGADGIKILKPLLSDNNRYWYHALLNTHIENLGYSRHFKLLKEASFPVHPYPFQIEVCAVLDTALNLIELAKNTVANLQTLVKSRFIEMFGSCSDSNKISLQNVCSIITDGTHQPPKFYQKGIPFLFVSNIANNILTYETGKYITEEDYATLIKRTPIEKGDVLISAVGSFGHPAIVRDNQPFCFQRHIAYLKPIREVIDSDFLHAALLSEDSQRYMDQAAKGVAQRTVTLKSFKKMRIPLPPLALQREFAAFARQAAKLEFVAQKQIEKLQLLYDSLAQEYFG